MNVDRYIGELLYDYECVILPGLGGFISNKKPANVNKITHQFFPPFYQLFFNVHLTENDGLLINYIAKRENLSFKEAKSAVESYVEECKNHLQSGHVIKVTNIGSLSQDSSGNIYFRQETKVNYNPDSFGLTEFVSPLVKRQTDEEKIKGLIIPLKKEKVKHADRKLVRLVSKKGLSRLITRAAIFIVLISAISWGLINKDRVGSYITEYASINPFANKTPQYEPRKSLTPLNIENGSEIDEDISTGKVEESNADLSSPKNDPVEADKSIPFEAEKELSGQPTTVSVPETKIISEQPTKEIKSEPDNTKSIPAVSRQTKLYYIIAGSFEKETNATKLIGVLRAKGFDAKIADTNKYGMYRVAYEGIESLKVAKEKLIAIRNEDNAEAWILKK